MDALSDFDFQFHAFWWLIRDLDGVGFHGSLADLFWESLDLAKRKGLPRGKLKQAISRKKMSRSSAFL